MKKTWGNPNISVLGIEETEVLIRYAECHGHKAITGDFIPCKKPGGSSRYDEGGVKFETDGNIEYREWRTTHTNTCGGGDPRNVIIQLFS
ncbi:hypothetical protein [Clostridium tarantellae]|uniref:Uncharacterized protein n=1 Tax=Clostridium tarantellae TaxID=39493 RepID=A0A6I1MKV6_9CLOT|nr:hypothetical protein [Clostridium tarantellae]MPQ43660.1 hypothetical protein [Clostridium tarantellae]